MSALARTVSTRPAEMLAGVTLKNGWKVTSIAKRSPTSTGGNFSIGYHARHADGRKGFLKAIDLTKVLQEPDTMKAMQQISEAYNFEVEVCNRCLDLKNIVSIYEYGEITPDSGNPGIGKVFYLLFEAASGDIRAVLDRESRENDLVWKLRTLKNVAAGIHQLHLSGITHQDLKPSNVLAFDDELFKVGDLGSSSTVQDEGPRDQLRVPGDLGYAPVELFYDPSKRQSFQDRCAADLYLLGSLIFFHFGGTSARAALIAAQSRTSNALRDQFSEDLPIWQQAFAYSLDDLAQNLDTQGLPKKVSDELISLVAELCEPDPLRRGNKKRLQARAQQRLLAQRYEGRFLHLERLSWVHAK